MLAYDHGILIYSKYIGSRNFPKIVLTAGITLSEAVFFKAVCSTRLELRFLQMPLLIQIPKKEERDVALMNKKSSARKSDNMLRIYVALAVSGLIMFKSFILLIIGVSFETPSKKEAAFFEAAKDTMGEITDFVYRRGPGGTDNASSVDLKVPVVRYTVDGIQYEDISWVYSLSPEYKVGLIVKVYYDPENPNSYLLDSMYMQDFRARGTFMKRLGLLLIGGSGVVFVTSGIALHRRKRRK